MDAKVEDERLGLQGFNYIIADDVVYTAVTISIGAQWAEVSSGWNGALPISQKLMINAKTARRLANLLTEAEKFGPANLTVHDD